LIPAAAPALTGTYREGQCGRDSSAGDEIELLPGADGGAVGDQRRRARVLGGDIQVVGQGEQADRATRVLDETDVKSFPVSFYDF
jgi:hypothetical protein